MIAVCIPSRGLIHSHTIEHVLRNIQGKDARIFITHNKPIPVCFNELTKQALQAGADYIWYVEEDMQFADDTLDALLSAGTPVATIDYPVSPKYMVVDRDGDVLNKFGTGCTLVDVTVFDTVGHEWRSDIGYMLPDWTPVHEKGKTYGQQDVDFAQRCKRAGVPVSVVGEGNQYRLISRGEAHTNDGWHDIRTIS